MRLLHILHVFVAHTAITRTFSRCKVCLHGYTLIDTNSQLNVSREKPDELEMRLNESEWVFNHSKLLKIIRKTIRQWTYFTPCSSVCWERRLALRSSSSTAKNLPISFDFLWFSGARDGKINPLTPSDHFKITHT